MGLLLSPNFLLRNDEALYPLEYQKVDYPQRLEAFRRLCRQELEKVAPVTTWEVKNLKPEWVEVTWFVKNRAAFTMTMLRIEDRWRISNFLHLAYLVQNHTYQ
jgi:hypothetical protein